MITISKSFFEKNYTKIVIEFFLLKIVLRVLKNNVSFKESINNDVFTVFFKGWIGCILNNQT